MIQVYNTATKQKETLQTQAPNKIGIYVCGMTVYNYIHLGNARVLAMFDTITRYLRHRGFEVNYIRNITDVDDKIITKAHENKEPVTAVTERFINAMHEDEDALNILRPSHEPRATEFMAKMIKMIETLIEKDHAYVADNGDVYYRVSSFESYGALSHQDVNDLRAGSRVDVVDAKRDPLDFVLWKMAKPDEPAWPSPWGEGRPGWHIECSAMSTHHLGDTFDIHGGGFDLTFPHHENERAQSEAATGKPFVKTWMHVGYVQIDKQKMSKSLGNFFTVRELLTRYHPEVVRYLIVSSHYRSPLNFSLEQLDTTRSALERLYLALRDLDLSQEEAGTEFETRFNKAMDDDFNTANGLAVLFDMVREVNRLRETDLAKAGRVAAVLKRLANLFGILNEDPESYLTAGQVETESGVDVSEIESLIAARNQARAEKDWAKSDQIRDELAARGILLEDKAGETRWRRVALEENTDDTAS